MELNEYIRVEGIDGLRGYTYKDLLGFVCLYHDKENYMSTSGRPIFKGSKEAPIYKTIKMESGTYYQTISRGFLCREYEEHIIEATNVTKIEIENDITNLLETTTEPDSGTSYKEYMKKYNYLCIITGIIHAEIATISFKSGELKSEVRLKNVIVGVKFIDSNGKPNKTYNMEFFKY
jgi:hypothetical protein